MSGINVKLFIVSVFSLIIFTGCNDNISNNINAVPLNSQYAGDGLYAAVILNEQPRTVSDPEAEISDTVPLNTNQNTDTIVRLSEFTTEFGSAKTAKAANIRLASGLIHNKTVMPGEVFSYNDAVGPTTKNNGFKLGRIFIKGREAKGYGGGVCQVSSTLYNAALQAGLLIVERHTHSKPVEYVEKDKDAATSYGVIDFKFKNNKGFPIKITSYIVGETVTVAINRLNKSVAATDFNEIE